MRQHPSRCKAPLTRLLIAVGASLLLCGAACAMDAPPAGAPPQAAVPQSGQRPATVDTAVPVPAGLFPPGVSAASPPDRILSAFLNLPYREDGAINDAGQYTLFAAPQTVLRTPGLNCSGLVLEASRLLLRTNIPLERAVRDRLDDSGPDSPHGEDWDFGWDLLLNIAEGFPSALLLPGDATLEPAKATGFSPRGFDLHAPRTKAELLSRLRPGYLYLLSFSKDVTRKGYQMQHYHVGLVHVAPSGEAWLYQTTGKAGKANRRDISSESGWNSFIRSFANTGNVRKMLLVLEVELPR